MNDNKIRYRGSSIDTSAVHGGRRDFAQLGVHAPPLDLSTTYPLSDLGAATASLDALACGAPEAPNPIYSRLYNPTVARFEEALAGLEGAPQAVAFASGMAALTACLLAARQHGTHVVAVRPLYGGSDHLLASGLLGMEVTWAEPGHIADALRENTSLVIVETPANPTLQLLDLRQVVADAGSVPVLVDSTFATPVLQNPLALGARMVLHSATKFLGGHGDVLAGVVATDEEWGAALRQVRVVTGAVLHPLGGYLLHRGLTTLPVRGRAAQQGAQVLARRLLEHPGVSKVFYPGLPDCDPQGLVGTQMRGPGSLIAFDVTGGFEMAARTLRSLRLITPAVSLGSTDTLIQHPAGLTHRVVSEEGRKAGGIDDGMLRLSVGLEDPEDLWQDLRLALDCALELAEAPMARAVAGS
jgi:methionine-gamma-lyase